MWRTTIITLKKLFAGRSPCKTPSTHPWCVALLLMLVFIAPLGGVQVGSSSHQLDQLIQQAQECQRRGDYAAAEEHYREILKLRPDFAEAYANLGLTQYLLGKYPEAVKSLQAALRLDGHMGTPNLFLGLDFLQMQETAKALPYLERAHRLNPRDIQPVLALGQAHVKLQDYWTANRFYSRACQMDPNSGDAWYGLGVTHLSLAREAAEKLRDSAQDSLQARLLVAESLEERGWFRDAAASYREILQQHPKQPGLLTALGFCILLQDESSDVDAALAEFQEELNDHPGYLLARLGRARVALELKKPQNALNELCDLWVIDSDFVRFNVSRLWTGLQPERLDDLGRLLKEGPTNGNEDALFSFLKGALQTWNTRLNDTAFSFASDEADGPLRHLPSVSGAPEGARSQQLVLQGRYTECATNLRPRMLQLSPADLELLAECSYDRGDYQTAFLADRQLVKAVPRGPAALFWQARTSVRLGVAALTKAVEVDPNSARMLYMVAEGYRENNSYKEAEAAYQKTLELQPTLIAARLGLASIYMATAENEKARVQLEKALEQKPADREAAYMMGDVLVTLHRYAEAMPYLSGTAQSPFVNPAHIHMLRSKVYLAEGKPAEALVEVETALPADPDGSYHYQLAQIYKQLGELKASASALEVSEKIRRASKNTRRLREAPGLSSDPASKERDSKHKSRQAQPDATN